MTVNKLTYPAKENAVQEKINEIIDNISVTGGANIDLSNLSATGESHFQEPLISGTNIKSINSIPLLGSGNIDTKEIFVAEYGTATYADVLEAYNAGKTIIFRYGSIVGHLQRYTAGNFYFYTFFENSNSNSEFTIYKFTMNGVVQTNGYELTDTDLSNLSTTGKKVIPSQWVNSYQILFENTSLTNSSGTALTKTITLPDDDCQYEVLLTGRVQTGTSSGNNLNISVTTNVLTNSCYFVAGITRSSSYMGNRGGIIVPIKHGTNNISIARASNFNGTAWLYCLGYKRLGTNSDT